MYANKCLKSTENDLHQIWEAACARLSFRAPAPWQDTCYSPRATYWEARCPPRSQKNYSGCGSCQVTASKLHNTCETRFTHLQNTGECNSASLTGLLRI